jgi:hypothetical protein
MGGLDAHFRAHGFRPTVPESLGLWYYWRQQVYPGDGKVIVLAGTSRVSSAVSLATMRECLPDYRIVQLGILGPVSCIGVLKDLVDDPVFRGIVICELDAPLLYRSEWDGNRIFRTYQPPTLPSLIDVVTKAWLQDHLTLLADPFTLRKLLSAQLEADPAARPDKMRRAFSREIQWDFGSARDEVLQNKESRHSGVEYTARPPQTWENIVTDARDINALIERLRVRGGNVVFLRAPSSGSRWSLEQEFCPRANNWDRFTRLTTAVCIHFQDVPEMHALRCPDESHLDTRDSPRFTRALISRLPFVRPTIPLGRAGHHQQAN